MQPGAIRCMATSSMQQSEAKQAHVCNRRHGEHTRIVTGMVKPWTQTPFGGGGMRCQSNLFAKFDVLCGTLACAPRARPSVHAAQGKTKNIKEFWLRGSERARGSKLPRPRPPSPKVVRGACTQMHRRPHAAIAMRPMHARMQKSNACCRCVAQTAHNPLLPALPTGPRWRAIRSCEAAAPLECTQAPHPANPSPAPSNHHPNSAHTKPHGCAVTAAALLLQDKASCMVPAKAAMRCHTLYPLPWNFPLPRLHYTSSRVPLTHAASSPPESARGGSTTRCGAAARQARG